MQGDERTNGNLFEVRELVAEQQQHKVESGGAAIGILIFLGGVALLAATFKLAYDLYRTDPRVLFNLKPDAELNLNDAGTQLVGVIIKIVLLLVMAVVGGVIANRGIRMYVDSRHPPKTVPVQKKTEIPTQTPKT